jgi:Na+-translocating ferredoxin:NAD+ oxidoreductase RnfD subunit
MSSDTWQGSDRLGGLRRFAVAITILNLLGHFFLGFEQSYAQPLCSLATAYGMEILLEAVDSRVNGRRPRFLGGWRSGVDFLLSAHITGLAVAMLLYSNERLWPTVFAAAAAVGSKSVFRVSLGKGIRHVFNPSNFGIALALLLFPWVGIAPPYHFSENLPPVGRWLLPAVIVLSGTYLNTRFTRRLPLIAAWLTGFSLQALVRSVIFHTPVVASLLPMSGVAFILYTFYMVTDPATTPSKPWSQMAFGAGVSAAYGLLMLFHIVFGLFFALVTVCALRLLALYLLGALRTEAPASIRAVMVPVAERSAALPGPAAVLLERIDS